MRLITAVACASLLLGCAARATAPATGERGQAERPAWKTGCAELAKAPVQVSYEDAAGGAAVLYRTKGNVEALRTRAKEVARFHNGGRSKIPALHDLASIPHRAYVAPLDDGAKLVLVPKSTQPAELDALRRNVQQDVWIIQRKGCGRGQEAL